MSEDVEAREMFDIMRGAPEPVWNPDTAAFAATGRRQGRNHSTALAGGAAALSVAVAVSVVAAMGTSSGGRTAVVVPGGGPVTTAKALASSAAPVSMVPPLRTRPESSSISTYAAVEPNDTDAVPPNQKVITPDIQGTLFGVLKQLDPGLQHVNPPKGAETNFPVTPAAPGLIDVTGGGTWTAAGVPVGVVGSKTPFGQFGIMIQVRPDPGALSNPDPTTPCGYTAGRQAVWNIYGTTDTVPTGMPPGLTLSWAPCTSKQLDDGSVIEVTSATIGAGHVYSGYRKFADGGYVAVFLSDFGGGGNLTPVPQAGWSADVVVAALSDSRVTDKATH